MNRVFSKKWLAMTVFLGMALVVSAIPSSAVDYVKNGNQVVCGSARFDILSPTLIRMQYSTNGFVDAPTTIITNREMKCTDYTVVSKDGWLTINTAKVKLRYQLNSVFISDTLRAIWIDKDGTQQWTPGVSDDKNLGGPPASFNDIYDSTAVDRTLPKFQDGFLSRSGYFLLDDSASPTWNDKTQWIAPRAKPGSKDWYLFVYGDNYKGFFKQYTELAGKIPMIPRYVLGSLVTDLNFEYSNQKAQEARLSAIIDRFRSEKIPLDTFVFDFGWHIGAWEAMDWSPAITDAAAFLNKCKAEGIKVAVNDHPGSLPTTDSHTATACEKLGLSPIQIHSTYSTIPGIYFNLADQKQAAVWMDFQKEQLDRGLSFWWIDGDAAQMDGLNSQMWTNRLYYETEEKCTGKRGFVLSRYGGLGNHRYPGYFTGDCHSNWKVLSYEIPYLLKAGNTLIPYVSNDISGFGEPITDNFELYARWVEFGSLSPILRLHSTVENPNDGNARLPWNYGQKGIDLARRFYQLRYRLIPYIYTYCREAYDTGMPICRPLYLDYPDNSEAYNHFDEYMLGGNLLVAPITAPAVDGVSARSVYFPHGNWIDYFTGKKYKGGQSLTYSCPLDRMPLFVKEGSIIPMAPDMQYTTHKPVDPLTLDIYPGKSSSTFALYEDDGSSLGYKKGEFCRTGLYLDPKHDGYTIRIASVKGEYPGQQKSRAYLVKLHCTQKPIQAFVDGNSIGESNGSGQGWSWDASSKTATIRLSSSSISKSKNISVTY